MLTTILCVNCLSVSATEKGVTLVRDYKPAATIVVSAKKWQAPVHLVGDREIGKNYPWWPRTPRDAAKELQTIIRKSTGAELPIVTDEEAVEGTLILVGESQYTKKMGQRYPGHHPRPNPARWGTD